MKHAITTIKALIHGTRLIPVAAVFMLVGGDASVATVWSCTYPNFSESKAPTTSKYIQDGKVITETISGYIYITIKYNVLQDNEVGLVAVEGFASKGKKGNLILGASVIAIDKKTLSFRVGNVSFGKFNGMTRNGVCTKE